ncbi:type II toxin-antitoxin system Phd/YefM family antitoxin [Arsenicicoccus sp. oral taxon 190]|uniref:type II toxin-antitoxin system Phd/YefM family antitoxin n=1 Tax=Arsenicicoccus sp. oral taxon 190 TaxID=1658671 RepID=UPI00067A1278|nr:type II toxin-antitoxin system prevent-host-death family antitoxin [Arsenicicoccus sp. oral taxon 190]AKT50444.1 prevent-host-death protein [Arsenicicoccus sp. oral taxon 190]
MDTVGLRELRQDASGLLRRVKRGEEIVITVSGRPSARLVPARQTRWRRWDDVSDLLAGPVDADWATDRELVEDSLRDPWADQ